MCACDTFNLDDPRELVQVCVLWIAQKLSPNFISESALEICPIQDAGSSPAWRDISLNSKKPKLYLSRLHPWCCFCTPNLYSRYLPFQTRSWDHVRSIQCEVAIIWHSHLTTCVRLWTQFTLLVTKTEELMWYPQNPRSPGHTQDFKKQKNNNNTNTTTTTTTTTNNNNNNTSNNNNNTSSNNNNNDNNNKCKTLMNGTHITTMFNSQGIWTCFQTITLWQFPSNLIYVKLLPKNKDHEKKGWRSNHPWSSINEATNST